MATSWRPFMISTLNSRMPPLLISTAFTTDSYKIYLTDLTNLWCEDIDRRSILRRSLLEDTSIDPSQDSGQFKLFLEKIRLGLDGGKDVDLWLSLGTRASKGGPPQVKSLDINLSIALPGPLQPLKWTIELAPCPQRDFAAYFTLPLLQAQNARLRELESLVGILRDKDNVIQKLVDKLEATGAELGHVFPGAAGKGGRKIPRKVAEERVKGLGQYEQESWRDDMKKLEDKEGGNDTRAAVRGAFRNDLGVELLGTVAEIPTGWDGWWEQLKDEAMRLSTREEKEEDTKLIVEDLSDESSSTDEEATEQENDDHFQVQSTPPQPFSPHKSKTSSSYHTRARNVINDDSDGEDDLGAASQSQPTTIPDSFPTSRRGDLALPKKLGAIGGPKKIANKPAKSPPPAPEPKSPVKRTRRQRLDEEDNDETSTEDEDAVNSPRKSATNPKKASPPVTAKPTKKGGIGKIGGKKKAASPSPASTPVDAPIAEESQLPSRAPKSKLGRIGHKQATKDADDGEESRGRSEKKEEEVEKPRETSEERAQRKREELKRQLEEKAKAPAKKKRRF